jgi:3-oxoacyl-[acyl-carrier-protein] synthase III
MNDGPIGILGLGAYVPERVMTNDDWAEYVDTSDEWITTRTGIKTRRVAADDETTVDLAVAAAENALEDAAMAASEIDEIIVATDTPEVYIPDTAPYIQQRLGAREVPSFDLAGSGCAGFVLGLDVARSRAMSGGKKVLVVGVELLTRLMDWSNRTTCVLFGDAAGAAVVGPTGEGGGELLTFTAGTDGAQAEILGLEAGGTRRPFTLEGAKRGEHKDIVMKGREVFKEAVTRMAAASREVLTQAGLGIDDLALVVPHQANLRIILSLQKQLGIPDDKLAVNVQDYGNTGSASVPLALWEARKEGRVSNGDLVLLTAFGAGFHWAAMILRL